MQLVIDIKVFSELVVERTDTTSLFKPFFWEIKANFDLKYLRNYIIFVGHI